MRIAVTADVHYDLGRGADRAEIDRVIQGMIECRPDVILLAGDQVGLGKRHLPALLDAFRPRSALCLAIAGNHDLWLPEGDSHAYYRETLPGLYRAHGFHLLDAGAVEHQGVGFAGVLGWYDYSFADPTLALGPRDAYATSRFQGSVLRNDKLFARLGRSDPQFCAEQLERLEGQLAELSPRVDRIIAVTHTVGLAEMTAHSTGSDEKRFERAYLGTAALTPLLARYPKVTHHFCGHVHREYRIRYAQFESVSIGSGYRTKRFEVLDV